MASWLCKKNWRAKWKHVRNLLIRLDHTLGGGINEVYIRSNVFAVAAGAGVL
jgi:hypothetical protein